MRQITRGFFLHRGFILASNDRLLEEGWDGVKIVGRYHRREDGTLEWKNHKVKYEQAKSNLNPEQRMWYCFKNQDDFTSKKISKILFETRRLLDAETIIDAMIMEDVYKKKTEEYQEKNKKRKITLNRKQTRNNYERERIKDVRKSK